MCSLLRFLLDLGQHVGLAQDEQLLALHDDLGAPVLGVQDLIALDDVKREALSAVVELAVTDGQDLALDRLLLRGVGEHDARGRRLLLLDRLDDQTIAQGLELHAGPPLRSVDLTDWHSKGKSATREHSTSKTGSRPGVGAAGSRR